MTQSGFGTLSARPGSAEYVVIAALPGGAVMP
jgi:hypothetical protein